MFLRSATKADSADLLRWRNDPVTRANSIHQHEITQIEHDAWLENSLANRHRSIFIAQNGLGTLGTVRVDQVGNHCEVSLIVAPEHRGNGYGTQMVQDIVASYPDDVLHAAVKPTNHSSKWIFAKAGFVFLEHHDGLDWLVRNP